MSLEISARKIGPGAIIVSPSGSIDTDTYLVFKEKLDPYIKAKPGVLVLDMEKVDYISSMGIGALIEAKKAIEGGSGKLVMVNIRPQVEKIFDIIKAIPSESIFTSRKELDDYLAKMQRKEIDKNEPF